MSFEIENDSRELSVMPVTTFVLWLGCLTVGVGGMLLRYPHPREPTPQPPPVRAQIVRVELVEDSSPSPDTGPRSPDASEPPTAPKEIVAPAAPPMVALAAPNPNIAFALPTERKTNTVEAKQAVPAQSPISTTTAPMAPRQLKFGQGEGRQPAPEYPREAALAHQQGTVIVRFTVGEDGRVKTARAISPSPFALLNQAAVRAVRETWRFRAGAVRDFEVSIEFQLKQR